MLAVSKFIDKELAVELNGLCKDYDRLKTDYLEAKETFEKVANRIKEICTEKDNETTKYLVKMTITPDSTIIDTKAIKEKYPEIAEECVKTKKGSRSIKEVLRK